MDGSGESIRRTRFGSRTNHWRTCAGETTRERRCSSPAAACTRSPARGAHRSFFDTMPRLSEGGGGFRSGGVLGAVGRGGGNSLIIVCVLVECSHDCRSTCIGEIRQTVLCILVRRFWFATFACSIRCAPFGRLSARTNRVEIDGRSLRSSLAPFTLCAEPGCDPFGFNRI